MNHRVLAARLRRRGSFLLCIGAVWIMHGFGILTSTRERFQGFGHLSHIVNHPYLGWGWIAAGVVGCRFAFRRVGDDGPGFIATQLPPLLGWLFLHPLVDLLLVRLRRWPGLDRLGYLGRGPVRRLHGCRTGRSAGAAKQLGEQVAQELLQGVGPRTGRGSRTG